MLGEVIHQTVPHFRFVLMPFIAGPRIFSNGEWPAGLEHEGNRGLRDLHDRRLAFTRRLELFVCDAVGDHYVQINIKSQNI